MPDAKEEVESNPSGEHLEMPRDRETFFFSRGAHLLCSLLERTYL